MNIRSTTQRVVKIFAETDSVELKRKSTFEKPFIIAAHLLLVLFNKNSTKTLTQCI